MDQQQQPSYEQWINGKAAAWEFEKSFTDKVLGRQDSDQLRTLIQKEDLTRQDFSEILVLIAGINQKLVNYNEWDRYILAKFFTWIREFVRGSMATISIQDEYTKILGALTNAVEAEKDDEKKKTLQARKDLYLSGFDHIKNIRNMNCDNAKCLFDVFSMIANSTLSLQAAGFDTLTTARFEYAYPGGFPTNQMPVPQETQKKTIFNFLKRK